MHQAFSLRSIRVPAFRPRALFALALTAAIGVAGVANAQATSGAGAQQRVDNRQDRQEQRIEQGVASGELNGRETRRLGRQEAAITRAEARAQADGRITRHEARALEHRQDVVSRHIYRQKHDGQVRPQ